MGLADCPKCWLACCECGYGYRDWSEKQLIEQIEMLKEVLRKKKMS